MTLADLQNPVKVAKIKAQLDKFYGTKSYWERQEEIEGSYYEALGEEIEKHPIGTPGILRLRD